MPPSEAGLPPGGEHLADEVRGRVAMIVGRPGRGKTTLARRLLRNLTEAGEAAALVCADVGQPAVGVPTCMALAEAAPWEEPSALWFVGDTTPLGNLLPCVVGTARLVERARRAGAGTVLLDTTGLVDTAAARVLKYHKALAAGAEHTIVLAREGELAPLAGLLGRIGKVSEIAPLPGAVDRGPEARRVFREARYREYFASAEVVRLDPALLIGRDWTPADQSEGRLPRPGTVLGLLDDRGFCLGLGIVEAAGKGLEVSTPCREPAAVVSALAANVAVAPAEGFAERKSR